MYVHIYIFKKVNPTIQMMLDSNKNEALIYPLLMELNVHRYASKN